MGKEYTCRVLNCGYCLFTATVLCIQFAPQFVRQGCDGSVSAQNRTNNVEICMSVET
jgi:hypothetical protein